MRVSHLIAAATLETVALAPTAANAVVKPTCAKDVIGGAGRDVLDSAQRDAADKADGVES